MTKNKMLPETPEDYYRCLTCGRLVHESVTNGNECFVCPTCKINQETEQLVDRLFSF